MVSMRCAYEGESVDKKGRERSIDFHSTLFYHIYRTVNSPVSCPIS